ncbi:MAG: thermonuclease family protein [Defluviicoccus sp.]|nr:thermonuclease family protein [Defluviicoccus sp.]
MELLLVLALPAGYLVLRTLLRRGGRGHRPGDTISGKAYVTDGDGLRVRGRTIRIAGVDAPEHDQAARHRDGTWFPHGKRVKSELIREIGGKHVRVSVEGVDRFGRLLGNVTCQGRDIGEWLVREGHAIAAYSDRYKHVEREARRARRGMWDHAHNFDPRDHRRRRPGKG